MIVEEMETNCQGCQDTLKFMTCVKRQYKLIVTLVAMGILVLGLESVIPLVSEMSYNSLLPDNVDTISNAYCYFIHYVSRDETKDDKQLINAMIVM